jgi:hypothetical protein
VHGAWLADPAEASGVADEGAAVSARGKGDKKAKKDKAGNRERVGAEATTGSASPDLDKPGALLPLSSGGVPVVSACLGGRPVVPWVTNLLQYLLRHTHRALVGRRSQLSGGVNVHNVDTAMYFIHTYIRMGGMTCLSRCQRKVR